MTKQLMTWARSVSGMGKKSGKAEFSSQAALQSYLRQHPGADASKHSVAQPKAAPKPQNLATGAEIMAGRALRTQDPALHAKAADALSKAASVATSPKRRKELETLAKQHSELAKNQDLAEIARSKAEQARTSPRTKNPAEAVTDSTKNAEARSEQAVRSKSPEAHADAAAAMKKAAGEHWRLQQSTKAAQSRLNSMSDQHAEAARDPKIAKMWAENMQLPDRTPEPHHLTETARRAHELSDKAARSQSPEDHKRALAAMKKAANENLQLQRSSAAAHRQLSDVASQHEQAARDPKIAAMWHANVHG